MKQTRKLSMKGQITVKDSDGNHYGRPKHKHASNLHESAAYCKHKLQMLNFTA